MKIVLYDFGLSKYDYKDLLDDLFLDIQKEFNSTQENNLGISLATVSTRDDKFTVIQNYEFIKSDLEFIMEFERQYLIVTIFPTENNVLPEQDDIKNQPKLVKTLTPPRPALLYCDDKKCEGCCIRTIDQLDDILQDPGINDMLESEIREIIEESLGESGFLVYKNQFYIRSKEPKDFQEFKNYGKIIIKV